jgi:histone deacetylase complex regulatory component SIN3
MIVPRSVWSQFLRALHLHSNEVLSRDELVTTVNDVFKGDFSHFARKFRDAIGFDAWTEAQVG